MTATDYELAFWGDCLHTLEEERKHLVYAPLMGIGFGPARDVIDIGGGPVSMLLKCASRERCFVLDPLMDDFPEWVRERYAAAGVDTWAGKGEERNGSGYAEAWIYNVLQHVDDPELVLRNARLSASVVRLFEWVDIPAYEGHPHMLTAAGLRSWLGTLAFERELELAQDGCYGRAYVAVTL